MFEKKIKDIKPEEAKEFLIFFYNIELVFSDYYEKCKKSINLQRKNRTLNPLWKKQSISKEYYDIISRFTSNDNYINNTDLINKFIEEVESKFKVKLDANKLHNFKNKHINLKIKVTDDLNISISDLTQRGRTLTLMPGKMNDMMKILNINSIEDVNDKNITLVTFYYNQRHFSGSNWSPNSTYEEVPGHIQKVKMEGSIPLVVEGFCGLANNQYEASKRRDIPIEPDACCMLGGEFIKKLADKPYVDKIHAAFPKGTYDAIKKYEDRETFILMLNPVYAEKIMEITLEETNNIFNMYPDKNITVYCSFPNWKDFIDEEIRDKEKDRSYKMIDFKEKKHGKLFNAKMMEINFNHVTFKLVRKD